MTLMNRSDVKKHLSTRSGSPSIFPSGLTRPDAVTAPASGDPETRADDTETSISPARTIAPEAVPNSPAGDSVIPAKAGDSGSFS